jgi:hypothetical protein
MLADADLAGKGDGSVKEYSPGAARLGSHESDVIEKAA